MQIDVGQGKFDNKFHIYDIKRNTAHSLTNVSGSVDNLIQNDVATTIISQNDAMSIDNILIDENQYNLKVIVGFTSGNNMILYDLVDFENTNFTIRKAPQAAYNNATASGAPSNTIISENAEKSTENTKQFSLKKVDDNQISLLDLLKEVSKELDAEFMDKATQNVDKLLKEFNINEGESFDRNKEGDEVGRRGVEGIRRIFTQRGPKTAEQSRIYDQFVEQNNGFEVKRCSWGREYLAVKEGFYTYEMIRQAQVNKENGLDTVFYLGCTRNTATHREGNASGFYIPGRNIIYISTSLHSGNADVVVASTGSTFLIQQKSVGQKGQCDCGLKEKTNSAVAVKFEVDEK